MKIRLSRKFVLILGGGLLLCGASGAAAVLIGADKILGPSYRDLNGLSCTTLKMVKLKQNQRYWVRKYVTSDEESDGISRIRTALRVARAVQAKEKADLVQVAMIDKAGPKDRAEMRGRMIAAQVVYIPDLAKVPEGAAAVNYSAYYLDGSPTAKGEYFGMRIDLPLEDVQHLEAKLTDKADCIDPEPAEGAHLPVTKSGHGISKPAGHGEAAGGHGEAPAGHGEASEHGEAPVAEGHDAAPTEAHGDEVAAKESDGFLSSVTGMLFGSKEEPKAEHGAEAGDQASAAAEGHGAAAEGSGHKAENEGEHVPAAVNDEGGHGAQSPAPKEHGIAAEGDHGSEEAKAAGGHDATKAQERVGESHSAIAETGEDHGEQAAKPAQAAQVEKASEKAVETDRPVDETSLVDQVKGMIFGGTSGEAEGSAHEEAKADAGQEAKHAGEQAHEPAPEPRTSAEGGKRWSNATEKDEIRSDDHAAGKNAPETEPETEHADAKPVDAGPNEADAAGAAWLEKFRAQPATPAAEGAKH